MTELTGKVGFASPISEKALSKKRTLGVELIATLALAVSLIIAATAVSFGVARAQSLAIIGHPNAPCYSHTIAAACANAAVNSRL
jgi:hypothetical protein